MAYIRGEKDLFLERERVAWLRKQQQDSILTLGLSGSQKRRMERFWKVASLLQQNSRMSLSEISKELKVPISTLFDTFEELKKVFLFTIVLREGVKDVSMRTPLTFEFGYQASMAAGAEKGTQCTLNSE